MIQKMPEGVDSKFRLALLVARRAEQLMRGARPKIETDRPVKPTRLAAHEVPREIEFLDDLPKTTTGKIMRRALRPTT